MCLLLIPLRCSFCLLLRLGVGWLALRRHGMAAVWGGDQLTSSSEELEEEDADEDIFLPLKSSGWSSL
jgi:hypothetical protein